MATTFGQLAETVSSLTISGLNSLASNGIAISDAINFEDLTPDCLDVLVEFVIDPGTTAGNRKAGVFLITSLDGTNYSDNTNTSNMIWVGDIGLPDTTALRSPSMSLFAALRGGFLPAKGKIAVWNDTSVAFNSSGNSCQIRVMRHITD